MKLVVFGAGQLAQMMYLAAAPLGVEVNAVDVKSRMVVHPVSKQPLNVTLEEAFDEAQAITAEFEHVPEELLYQADKTNKLFPDVNAILTGADRVREKALLESAGVANAQYLIIREPSQVQAAINQLGPRLVFKASRDGYDGYGQWRCSDSQQVPQLEQKFARLNLAKVPLIAEKMVPFTRELSVVGARRPNGQTHVFSLAENIHHEGQLHVSIAPAPGVTDELQNNAECIFHQIAEALNYVGVLAVEMFQVGQELLVNEIAPRVHNSGHWTQNGAETCQFEQHVRAILDFPLGDTRVNKPTLMLNIIGCTSFSRELISIPGCHLHWYGKEVRPKRKMGHINLTATSYQALGQKLTTLKQYLPMEYFPKLDDQIIRLNQLSSV